MWLGDCNSFFLLLLLLVFVLSILPENVNTRVETEMRMYDLLRPYRDMCTVNVAFPVFILCLYIPYTMPAYQVPPPTRCISWFSHSIHPSSALHHFCGQRLLVSCVLTRCFLCPLSVLYVPHRISQHSFRLSRRAGQP